MGLFSKGGRILVAKQWRHGGRGSAGQFAGVIPGGKPSLHAGIEHVVARIGEILGGMFHRSAEQQNHHDDDEQEAE